MQHVYILTICIFMKIVYIIYENFEMQTYMLLIHCWALLITKVASVCIQCILLNIYV